VRAIAAWIDRTRASHEHAVVTCSALKRAYRDIIVNGRHDVRLVYLKGGFELIAQRMAARHGHFMPVALLHDQFATLQEPTPEENPVVVPVNAPPDAIVERIVTALGLQASPSAAKRSS
jgi:gluconokinase